MIENTLQTFFQNSPAHPIVIAYSGGVDSQVLLYALAKLKGQGLIANPITACHVNHGLSDNAQAWQLFAEKSCKALSVDLKVACVNVKAKAQHSLEALARDARYQALTQVNKQASFIITGHHSDDQSETFLLALKRGSGIKGLSAMAKQTMLAQHYLVRPLLAITRDDIVAYAKAHQLDWVEDESNTDTRFDRNFIRQDIMPLLKTRWPSIARSINRSAQHCLEGQSLLDELAAGDLSHCLNQDRSLSIDYLLSLSEARFNNAIRYYLDENHCLMPSSEQLRQLRQQLNCAEDKMPNVKVSGGVFRRYKSALFLTANFASIENWQKDIELSSERNSWQDTVSLPDNLAELRLSYGEPINELASIAGERMLSLNLPDEVQQITIRFSHNNPRCLPDYRKHSRPLKKVLQELAIPPWQRKRIPLIYFDDEFVAAAGYFVCQDYLSKNEANKLTIQW